MVAYTVRPVNIIEGMSISPYENSYGIHDQVLLKKSPNHDK